MKEFRLKVWGTRDQMDEYGLLGRGQVIWLEVYNVHPGEEILKHVIQFRPIMSKVKVPSFQWYTSC